MSTLCVATDSNHFSHLLFHNVGVVKPSETVTVIKSYSHKREPGHLKKRALVSSQVTATYKTEMS